MNVMNSELLNLIEATYVSDKGNFYFFNKFIVSEMNQGAIFSWEDSLEIQSIAIDYYGEQKPIGYISNRVNKYSVRPTDWLKFKKMRNLTGYAIVAHTEQGWINALIERLFFKGNMERFRSLYDAVEWIKTIDRNHDGESDYLSAV